MATNPFAGTAFEQSWDEGFSVGFIAPNDIHLPPSPLAPEQHPAYAAGIVAGAITSRGILVPPGDAVPSKETWEVLLERALEAVVEVTPKILIKKFPNVFPPPPGGGQFTVAGTAAEVAVLAFLATAIWGPVRLPFFEEAAAQAMARTRKQLQETGIISDNIELFMAACIAKSHGISPQDELTSQGWFHGRVFLQFNRALEEAKAHGHFDDTRVLRFQSAAPDTIEIIEIAPA
jgi:hypothetical protein